MKIQDLREQIRSSLPVYGKVVVPQMFTMPSPRFHFEISRTVLDPQYRFINIIAPRDHAKSSLVGCIKVLHHIFFDPGPKFILLVSKTEGHAIRLLDTIKDALNYSASLRALFGYHGQFNAKKWTSTEVVLDNDVMILCRGTGQMVRGLKHGHQRPTLIILDDPEDENNTKTPEAMEINLRWLLQGLVPAIDVVSGRIIVIGTPLNERCMIETLARMKSWKTLRYRALHDEGPKESWTSLWPERMSVADLVLKKENLADIGRVSIFYREYQCIVIGDEDQLFRPEYIQYYAGVFELRRNVPILKLTERNGIIFDPIKILVVNVFMGVDPASSTRQTADFSTIVPKAVDSDGFNYVLPYYHKRASPMEVTDSIIEYYNRYKPIKTTIEATGYQEMIRDYLRRETFIPGMDSRKKELPRERKSKRLESMQPVFAKKKVFIQKNMSDLRDELLSYPRGGHDDLLDGLYYSFRGNYRPLVTEAPPEDAPREFRKAKRAENNEASYMTS